VRRMIEDASARDEAAAAGLRRAAHFSWAETARGTVRSFRRALRIEGGS